MSRIDELISELCPNGVEYIKIGEVVNYEQPTKYIVNSTDYDDDYETPVLTAGQTFILGYTDETDGIYNASNDKPVIIFDDFTGAFKWVNFPFKIKSSAMKILTVDNTKTTLRYVYHVMDYLAFSSSEHKRLWIGIYSDFKIPLPPLEIQEKIVRILDNFTELTSELTARKKQYEYYRDMLLDFGNECEWSKLGEIATVTKLAGFEFTSYVQYKDEGTIIALRGLNVKNGRLVLDDVKYIDGSDFLKLNRSKLVIDDMLFTYVGTVGQVALITENDKYYLAPNVALIRLNDKKIIPRFMMYYFQSTHLYKKQIMKLMQNSSMQNLTMEKIRKFVLPIPSIPEQERIVGILDRFDKLCNDISEGLSAEIEARRKQYEYYRNKLISFNEGKNHE